jgi:hypothetical protein
MPEMINLFGLSVALDMQLVILFAIVFVAGIIRGFLGFGSALLTVPALSMLYGPAQAVVIGVLIEIPTSLGLLPVAIRESERRTVWSMLLTFVVFVPVGALLLKAVDPELMKTVISFLVLAMVGIIALQDRAGYDRNGRTTICNCPACKGRKRNPHTRKHRSFGGWTHSYFGHQLLGCRLDYEGNNYLHQPCHAFDSTGSMGRVCAVSAAIQLEPTRHYTGIPCRNRGRDPVSVGDMKHVENWWSASTSPSGAWRP